jgi:hypothetical protein
MSRRKRHPNRTAEFPERRIRRLGAPALAELRSLRSLVPTSVRLTCGERVAGDESRAGNLREEELPLATAALLVHGAVIDGQVETEERRKLDTAVGGMTTKKPSTGKLSKAVRSPSRLLPIIGLLGSGHFE